MKCRRKVCLTCENESYRSLLGHPFSSLPCCPFWEYLRYFAGVEAAAVVKLNHFWIGGRNFVLCQDETWLDGWVELRFQQTTNESNRSRCRRTAFTKWTGAPTGQTGLNLWKHPSRLFSLNTWRTDTLLTLAKTKEKLRDVANRIPFLSFFFNSCQRLSSH